MICRITIPLTALLIAVALPASAAAASERYIVVLKDRGTDSGEVARQHRARHGASLKHVYSHALKGYAARIPTSRVDDVRADSRVAYVEPDGEVHASTSQDNATWGLDRIDQRGLPLSTSFTYTNTGAGVTAYIIDSGIRVSHSEFGTRATSGYDSVDGGSADDCNGHGTHVAGTTGGSTYGVAKGASLVAVRVLGCDNRGSWSGVIAGVDWVTGNHQPGQPAVANMSLGGRESTSVDTAVRTSIADGVSYAIAAMNGNIVGIAQDACKSSPARVREAMTISATDQTDKKASWANYGDCVDWFAPGVGIDSAWHTDDTATNTISGTSMATPHTAGAAALYLQGNSAASPAKVRDALYGETTKDIVTSSKTANRHLLFTNW